LTIIPLQERHLEDAARLFAGDYRRQRERLPVLPARHEDPGGVLPMLSDLLGSFPLLELDLDRVGVLARLLGG
jgi:hypothetical protein